MEKLPENCINFGIPSQDTKSFKYFPEPMARAYGTLAPPVYHYVWTQGAKVRCILKSILPYCCIPPPPSLYNCHQLSYFGLPPPPLYLDDVIYGWFFSIFIDGMDNQGRLQQQINKLKFCIVKLIRPQNIDVDTLFGTFG